MPIPLLQMDAFTSTPCAGNPAAVCLLPTPRDALWMQQVAIVVWGRSGVNVCINKRSWPTRRRRVAVWYACTCRKNGSDLAARL
jgi:hypothetical protein